MFSVQNIVNFLRLRRVPGSGATFCDQKLGFLGFKDAIAMGKETTTFNVILVPCRQERIDVPDVTAHQQCFIIFVLLQ